MWVCQYIWELLKKGKNANFQDFWHIWYYDLNPYFLWNNQLSVGDMVISRAFLLVPNLVLVGPLRPDLLFQLNIDAKLNPSP